MASEARPWASAAQARMSSSVNRQADVGDHEPLVSDDDKGKERAAAGAVALPGPVPSSPIYGPSGGAAAFFASGTRERADPSGELSQFVKGCSPCARLSKGL